MSHTVDTEPHRVCYKVIVLFVFNFQIYYEGTWHTEKAWIADIGQDRFNQLVANKILQEIKDVTKKN